MSVSIRSLSHKEKFIKMMNHILQLKFMKSKTITLVTKQNKIHYLKLNHYEDFIHSDSDKMETTTYLEDDLVSERIKSEVNPKDIKQIGYVPKTEISRRYIDF